MIRNGMKRKTMILCLVCGLLGCVCMGASDCKEIRRVIRNHGQPGGSEMDR